MKTLSFLFLIALANIHFVHSQGVRPVQDSLYSGILDENRTLQILLPEGYESNASKTYDVIYVIDGERVTNVVSAIHDMAAEWEEVPRCIIVGVNNKTIAGVKQRNRDLLPTHMDRAPLSGKANNFVKFFKQDLIPYINKKYPTTGRNTLFGHSHGGTFAIYSLLQEPKLFSAYITADPSLWWDDQYVIKLTDQKISPGTEMTFALFISGRAGEPYIGMGTHAMDSVLKKRLPQQAMWKSVAYKDETHFSIMLKTVYDGLKFVYQEFGE